MAVIQIRNGECICREPFAGKNCTSCIDNYYGKNCRHKCLNKNCEKNSCYIYKNRTGFAVNVSMVILVIFVMNVVMAS